MKKASEINAVVAIVVALCCAESSMVISFFALLYLGLSAWAFVKQHEEEF